MCGVRVGRVRQGVCEGLLGLKAEGHCVHSIVENDEERIALLVVCW